MGAETDAAAAAQKAADISTHSARGGGDSVKVARHPKIAISTHSARGGGDYKAGPHKSARSDFNPLRPWGRRLFPGPPARHPQHISTHSARGGGDRHPVTSPGSPGDFNPLRPWGRRRGRKCADPGPGDFNPLRPWGRRRASAEADRAAKEFQPTPPVGAETRATAEAERVKNEISTHSARGGGDQQTSVIYSLRLTNFNPLRPWGRRL